MKDVEILIKKLQTKIKHLSKDFSKYIDEIDKRIQQIEKGKNQSPNYINSKYCSLFIFKDSFEKINLIISQNIKNVETMNVLVVTRYIFELTIWLRLIEKDNNYGLEHYREFLKMNIKFYKKLQEHLELEIKFFKELDIEEKNKINEQTNNINIKNYDRISNKKINEINKYFDGKVSRRFSIYGEDSKINGFSFQAYLIETKSIIRIIKLIEDFKKKLETFNKKLPLKFKSLNWKERAKLVSMSEEYDFIYNYTSNLLHALPMSITTNQKNLEQPEVLMFLKYIYIRLIDILNLTKLFLYSKNT